MLAEAKKQPTPKTLELLSGSLSDLWQMKGTLAAVLLIIALPVAVITLSLALSNPDDSNSISPLISYTSLATLFMNVALVWSIIERKTGRNVNVALAYYKGTASAVRFMLVAVVMAFEFLPFLLGATIYKNGVTGGITSAGLAEHLLLALVWALFAWPSAFLLVRSAFALIIVAAGSSTPISAMRQSFKLVKGQSLAVFGRLCVLVLVMVLLLVVPSSVVISLSNKTLQAYGSLVLQLIATLVFLPYSSIYLYNLFLGLQNEQK